MVKNLCKKTIAGGLFIATVAILAPAGHAAPVPQAPSNYQIVMVDRTVKAVKYAHRSGSTKIDFEGTSLMTGARGEAKVDSHRGAMEIKVEFQNLEKPTSFGPEYLTYVMWAISPEGRQVNLGEILVGDNHRSKLDVTTDLSGLRHDHHCRNRIMRCVVPAT